MRFWKRASVNEIVVRCPGCEDDHNVCFGSWEITLPVDQDSIEVTIHPSIMVNCNGKKCHSFLQHGIWKFLPDSTHALSGMQVLMIPLVD